MKQITYQIINTGVNHLFNVEFTGIKKDGEFHCYSFRVEIKGERFNYFMREGYFQDAKDKVKKKYRLKNDIELSTAEIENQLDVHDVLMCLISDADCGELSFNEFCSKLGYNSDSISTFKIYQECVDMLEKMRKIFTRAELEALREQRQDW